MSNLNVNALATWNGGVKGNGSLKTEFLDANIAIPTVIGGSGNGANPKEVLVSSVTTCYSATLAFVLETRKLPVEDFSVKTEATISDAEFKIVHYPHVVLSSDATEEQKQSAQRAIEAADKGCEVGNMVRKADVIIEVKGEVSSK